MEKKLKIYLISDFCRWPRFCRRCRGDSFSVDIDCNGKRTGVSGASCADRCREVITIVSPEVKLTPVFYGECIRPRKINTVVMPLITEIIVEHNTDR